MDEKDPLKIFVIEYYITSDITDRGIDFPRYLIFLYLSLHSPLAVSLSSLTGLLSSVCG